MASIHIQRTSEYNNLMRDYKVFIDGQQAGNISNGQHKTFTTTPGDHTLTVKIDWCSSPDLLIRVDDNETIYLEVGGFKNGRWIMPVAAAILALHFILTTIFNISYTIFLVVPAFVLLFYYISLGRKRYLVLTEINKKASIN
ncbi:hypothetical protein [Sediminibacterium ginsengisoli]|uniref:PEGA domain-containing protein n=1 Tax=Sediminibacterium ginsengisoli TaxID=413434 RepID=A0A1T4JP23_9BACT|nr:hypothetical protein [Sediminibacterium ginsengisoli]SJZ31920.1 hypothetical protein SAMN04488132_1017 [Sediminibacterium ginsengisoli]